MLTFLQYKVLSVVQVSVHPLEGSPYVVSHSNTSGFYFFYLTSELNCKALFYIRSQNFSKSKVVVFALLVLYNNLSLRNGKKSSMSAIRFY